MGSPPQVRGKRFLADISSPPVRITPAGAGKTLYTCTYPLFRWDHPRRCGENRAAVMSRQLTQGSPPQVRGKLKSLLEAFDGHGITPAGAGKTAPSRSR